MCVFIIFLGITCLVFKLGVGIGGWIFENSKKIFRVREGLRWVILFFVNVFVKVILKDKDKKEKNFLCC